MEPKSCLRKPERITTKGLVQFTLVKSQCSVTWFFQICLLDTICSTKLLIKCLYIKTKLISNPQITQIQYVISQPYCQCECLTNPWHLESIPTIIWKDFCILCSRLCQLLRQYAYVFHLNWYQRGCSPSHYVWQSKNIGASEWNVSCDFKYVKGLKRKCKLWGHDSW